MNTLAALVHATAEMTGPHGQQKPGLFGVPKMIDDSLQRLKDHVAVIKGQYEQLSRQAEGVAGRVDAIQESIGGIKVRMDRQAERRLKWIMFAIRIVAGGGIAKWLAHRAGLEMPEIHH